MNTHHTTHRQSGAVSLFMVIFAMLLMSIVTIGFLRIMTSDQNQASSNDLSQSAYDSALAGVEDAKRALLWQATRCNTDPGTCSDAIWQSSMARCNASIYVSGVVKTVDYNEAGGDGTAEVKVQQSTATEGGESIDAALDQAYTCVTLQTNTDDYVAPLLADESKLIPLASTGPVSTITIQWFSRDNVPGASGALNLAPASGGTPLLSQADWPANRPSLMRAQYIQTGPTFTLPGFDATNGAQSNVNTVFLYPVASGGMATATLTETDIRRAQDGTVLPASANAAPKATNCTPSVAAGGYACSMTLTLPEPIGGGPVAAAYLRLTPLYRASNIRVTLGGALFYGVQPKVDSTGRANDLFRRVESRVDMYDATFPYPDAALDVNGNLCKDFSVTDTTYIPGTCTP